MSTAACLSHLLMFSRTCLPLKCNIMLLIATNVHISYAEAKSVGLSVCLICFVAGEVSYLLLDIPSIDVCGIKPVDLYTFAW